MVPYRVASALLLGFVLAGCAGAAGPAQEAPQADAVAAAPEVPWTLHDCVFLEVWFLGPHTSEDPPDGYVADTYPGAGSTYDLDSLACASLDGPFGHVAPFSLAATARGILDRDDDGVELGSDVYAFEVVATDPAVAAALDAKGLGAKVGTVQDADDALGLHTLAVRADGIDYAVQVAPEPVDDRAPAPFDEAMYHDDAQHHAAWMVLPLHRMLRESFDRMGGQASMGAGYLAGKQATVVSAGTWSGDMTLEFGREAVG